MSTNVSIAEEYTAEQYEFPERICHYAAVVDHCIVVFGGMSTAQDDTVLSMRDIYTFNLYTSSWIKSVIAEKQPAPSPRHSGCAAAIGSDIFAFGGYIALSKPTDQFWKLEYSEEGFRWSQVQPASGTSPSARANASCWSYGGKFWMFGGQSRAGRYTTDLHCYDPSGGEWSSLSCAGSPPPANLPYRTTQVLDGRVWVYGNTDRELYQLSMSTLEWKRIQTGSVKPPRRISHSFSWEVLSGTLLFLCHPSGRHWIFDITTNTWSEQQPVPNNLSAVRSCTFGIADTLVLISRSSVWTVRTTVKTLQQLALHCINKNRDTVPWKLLPKKLSDRMSGLTL